MSEDLFKREILTVSQLTGRLKDLIETEFSLIWISGEISNLSLPRSGHYYLTLKDEGAQIRAVMFKTQRRYLDFEPEDGQEVLVRGRISVYEPRGEYQIILDYMEPHGEGALKLAFEKLKNRLAAEGLFDQALKKPLPFLPERVALVTSPTGAAVRDFIKVTRRRFDNVTLSVYPVRVQGEGAAGEIAQAVVDLNRWGGFDLIVLTRGGGSVEDLWAFNEEVVARAVAASAIPVVSAVGHEIDFCITDFVADLRAPTPSAAAEIVFREKQALTAHVAGLIQRMAVLVKGRYDLARERMAHLKARFRDPGRIIQDHRLRLDDFSEIMTGAVASAVENRRWVLMELSGRLAPLNPQSRLSADKVKMAALRQALTKAARNRLRLTREALAVPAIRLSDLNPLTVLKRGYAVARMKPELISLRSAREVALGDRLNILLAEGELDVVVDEVRS